MEELATRIDLRLAERKQERRCKFHGTQQQLWRERRRSQPEPTEPHDKTSPEEPMHIGRTKITPEEATVDEQVTYVVETKVMWVGIVR